MSFVIFIGFTSEIKDKSVELGRFSEAYDLTFKL